MDSTGADASYKVQGARRNMKSLAACGPAFDIHRIHRIGDRIWHKRAGGAKGARTIRAARATKAGGFSLLELLVALLFTLLLMAGMASIFKSSVSSFAATGESVSSARRNRLSIELLGEDINMAGMYLTDMALPPVALPQNPPFYIIPNAAIEGPGADDPQNTDELYFYLDEPLPFEAILRSSPSQTTAAAAVMSGDVVGSPDDNTYTVDCQSDDYAKQVQAGQYAIFKDFWESMYVAAVRQVSGHNVTFSSGPSPNAGITGKGSQGLPSRVYHRSGSGVLFIRPAQMVRYRIEMAQLDPAKANGIPCLVRHQGEYSYSGAGPVFGSRQIITENVTGFKVYLSANGGRDWAGIGNAGSGKFDDWNGSSGIRGQIDVQLQTAGRPGQQTTRASEHWFRSIPTLVRVDITTRTATKRSEFSADALTAAYREMTQSLIFVPRHFGLPIN